MTPKDGADPLELRFLGSLIEQLGAQMYPSATAAVAELISNAWDADARNVWVEIPLGTEWTEDSEIVVIDDGHGMTRSEAQEKYLLVGRKRREVEATAQSAGGRKLHGRKGIGKLAAFGTARILEYRSAKDGNETAFRLDYDRIRTLRPTEAYEVEAAQDGSPLVDGLGASLENGTRIRLRSLRLKQALNEERFGRSMARRFAIAESEMKSTSTGTRSSASITRSSSAFPGTPSLTRLRSTMMDGQSRSWGTAKKSAGGLGSHRSHWTMSLFRGCRSSPTGRWLSDRSCLNAVRGCRASSDKSTWSVRPKLTGSTLASESTRT